MVLKANLRFLRITGFFLFLSFGLQTQVLTQTGSDPRSGARQGADSFSEEAAPHFEEHTASPDITRELVEALSTEQDFPLLAELEADYVASHPEHQQRHLISVWKRIQNDTPQSVPDSLARRDPELARKMEAEFAELHRTQNELQSAMEEEARIREQQISVGLTEAEDSDPSRVRFRIFDGFESIAPQTFMRQVARLDATQLFEGSSLLKQFDSRTAQQIQTAVADLKRIAAYFVANRPPASKFKGLNDMDPDEFIRFMMDRKKLQFPSKSKDGSFEIPEHLIESEPGVEARFTSVGNGLVMRLTLPEFEEEIVVMDDRFVAKHEQHSLMLLSRILLRSNDRNGREVGRPILLVSQSPAKNSDRPSVAAFYLEQPKKLTKTYADIYRIMAFAPRTRDDKFFSIVYTFNVTVMGYAVLHWKLSKAAAENEYFGPLINWPFQSMSELFYFDQTMALATSILVFAAWNIAPMASHIFYSSVIGVFHSVYRFVIYHGSKFWQGVKHLVLISFPAGLMTVLFVEGPSAVNPLTLVGLAGLSHILVNSLWTNFARPILYAAPMARVEHRLNANRIQLPKWLGGFSVKQQQIEAEFFGYALLFFFKFAHLVKLEAFGVPFGEMGFYALPFVAFVVNYSYLKWNSHKENFSKEIDALWDAFVAPIRFFVFKPVGVALDAIGLKLNQRMLTRGSIDPHPIVAQAQSFSAAVKKIGNEVSSTWHHLTELGFEGARRFVHSAFGLKPALALISGRDQPGCAQEMKAARNPFKRR